MTQSIVEAMLAHARREPDWAALLFEGETYTYGRLAAEVERFAAALVRWGLHPGERLALFLENRPEFVIAYLGTHRARGVIVLVNTQYRQVELRHIMTDAGVRLCVTDTVGAARLDRALAPTLEALVLTGESSPSSLEPHSEASPAPPVLPASSPARALPPTAPVSGAISTSRQPSAPGTSLNPITWTDFLRASPPAPIASDDAPRPPAMPPLPAPDDPAVIGYTSGTTGRAKGALLLHRNLIANVAAVASAWHWTSHDRLLLTLPLFHTHGLMVGLHGTLFVGASARLHRRFRRGCGARCARG